MALFQGRTPLYLRGWAKTKSLWDFAFEGSTTPRKLNQSRPLKTTAYAGLVTKIVGFSLRKTWHGGDRGGVQPTQNEEGNRHMWLCPPLINLWQSKELLHLRWLRR